MDVRDLSGRTALVTGAGSGIGRAIALEAARRGADLVLCDVNETSLKSTGDAAVALGRSVFARRVDVASASEMEEFARAVHGEVGGIDLLVNNAGVALSANFAETRLEDWDWILGINLKGVVHGCHFFVPRMVQRGRGGHVVNVASMAAFIAYPPVCAYNATKAAVVSLSESLRAEIGEHGIGVTAVCPGVIKTNILETMRIRGPVDPEEARALVRDLMARQGYPPERLALRVMSAIRWNRAIAPVSAAAWVFYYLKRLAPRALVRILRAAYTRQQKRLASGKLP